MELNANLQEIDNTIDSAKIFQAGRELTRMDKRPIIVKKKMKSSRNLKTQQKK